MAKRRARSLLLMYTKFVFPVLLGVFGICILVMLGIWQLQRLEWKTKILSNIEQKILAEPSRLTENLKEDIDQYRSVEVRGAMQPQEIHVLTSLRNVGPGFLVISPLKLTNGRLILVDRGFVPEDEKSLQRPQGEVKIIGNLLWPNEIDGFTPDPNFEKNIWFGRDLEKMSNHLQTEPILVVVREAYPSGQLLPQKIGVNIANNHLSYAITWFSLAAVWLGMTILLVYRIKRYSI